LIQFEREQLVAKLGKHRIRLTEASGTAGGAPDLRVEIDDREVAHISFRRSDHPRAGDALQALRTIGITRFVSSESPDAKTSALARRLGVDLSGGTLDGAGTVRFLLGLRKRGLKPVYVGRLSRHPELAAAAYLTIDTESLKVSQDCHGDILLLGQSYDSLPLLIDLARSCDPKAVGTARKATIPNLLCVAGAFAGLLNGITAGLIANVGVMGVDRELNRILKAQRPKQAA
jgi:cation transport ATPase